MDKLKRQLRLEQEMRTLGIAKVRDEVSKAQANERESVTSYGHSLMSHSILPTSKAISNWMSEVETGKARRKGIAYKTLKLITPEIAAFITAKTVLDCISKREAYTATLMKVASGVEDEIGFQNFRKDNKPLFDSIKRNLDQKRSGRRHQSVVFKLQASKKGIEYYKLDSTEKAHVGSLLVQLFVESTGLVEIVKLSEPGRKYSRQFIVPTTETLEWINKNREFTELLSPQLLPCIIKPLDWSDMYNGGFYTAFQNISLIKTRNKGYMERLLHHDMSQVYQAVNTLQATPWKINSNLLPVIQTYAEGNSTVGKLPPKDALDLPPRPVDIDENPEALREWKKAATEVYQKRLADTSRRIALMKKLWVADKFKDEEEIFFVYTLDFRGRVYPVQLFLHPQGDDVSKALLQFAEGKPLGEQGAAWLAVHGANLFGYDKAGLQDRIDWVLDNEDEILASARDPFENTFWQQADKPFQFLAFCYEWLGYDTEGEDYCSSLPIALDGSCNGLQNFAAMMRDERGGSAVNLTPSETPQDIYQVVADAVSAVVEKDTENPEMAALWRGRVDRKICKRPVMTLPYGVTKRGMNDHIGGELREQIDKGIDWGITASETYKAAAYLGAIVWDCIGDALVSSRVAMDWLKEVATVAVEAGIEIEWVTPAGLLVNQTYRKRSRTRIKTQTCGQLFINTEGSAISKRQQLQGIAPNFVHSMDASHMMRTVNHAEYNGVDSFAMVHDSFGTHAADTTILYNSLRHSFVDMYTDHDVLEEFRNSVITLLPDEYFDRIPPTPPKGKLDLSLVKQSDFFFA